MKNDQNMKRNIAYILILIAASSLISSPAEAGTLESLQQHSVAREDGLISVPLLMHRLVTTTHIGIVHQVVVQQGEVMIGLQSDGLRDDTLWIILKEIIAHQHQHRAHTLASQRQHVLDRFIQRERLAVVCQTV